MDNIVITGSRGFVGMNLMRMLESIHIPYEEVDLVIGKSLKDLVGRHGTLIHLAAWRNEAESFWQAEKYIENNVINLASILTKNHFAKVIFPSSSAVYNDQGYLEPYSIYGLTKLFGEKLIRMYNEKHYIFRIFQPYGPGDTNSVFYKMAQCKSQNQTFRLYSCKEIKRDYFHVDHVCNTIVLALNDVLEAGTYNVGSGKIVYVSEFLRKICEKYKIKYKIITPPVGTSLGFIPKSDYIYGDQGDLEEEWKKYL